MMKRSIFHDQADFLKAGDVKFPGNSASEDLAVDLIAEEVEEFISTSDYFLHGDYNALKEAIDCIYVLAQYLNVCVGPDNAESLWLLVHKNNMSKCIDGKLVKREDGKIMKPYEYKKLTDEDIKDIIN